MLHVHVQHSFEGISHVYTCTKIALHEGYMHLMYSYIVFKIEQSDWVVRCMVNSHCRGNSPYSLQLIQCR